MKHEPPAKASPPAKSSAGATAAGVALKALWTALVIATPVLGAWVASSLAAYANGPTALAAATGLLAFPALPLAWEAWANHRRRKAKVVRPRILTFLDRLVLRTLAVNLLFLGLLVGLWPRSAFAALSTRGDWMLDGQDGGTARSVRKGLFWAADRLEWVYLAVHDDTFEKGGDHPEPSKSSKSRDPVPPPAVTVSAAPSDKPSPERPSPAPSDSGSSERPAPAPSASNSPAPGQPSPDKPPSSTDWPFPAGLHPAVASMPKDAEESIATVARYIAERESDQVGRFRAAHDYVADRIAYDGPSYVAHQYPPQDAETVFKKRIGVCAGYSHLLVALGKALGLEVEYVSGDARTSGNDEGGASHAWNVVRLGGKYYLTDATWDSGSLDGATFKKHFRTDYLMAPPEVFGLDHFPRESRWQLREKPISRGDFFRQPMMTARFYAEGRELLSPLRSQVTVNGPFLAELKNKNGLFTLATWGRAEGGEQAHCLTENGSIAKVKCDLPGKGRYIVRLFSGAARYGSYEYVGQFEANEE